MSKRAALRYAKAVLDRADETGNQEVVYGNMKSIEGTLSASKELRNVLNSPVIKAEDKRAALHSIFSGVSETTSSLIDILIHKNRSNILGEVATSYLGLYNESQGLVVAEVTTAVELDEALEAKVLKKVKEITGSDKAQLENTVDPKIIGGFILRVGDVQYDASISNQLDKVQKEFSKRL